MDSRKPQNWIPIIWRNMMLKSCQLWCWMIMQTWMLSSKKINPIFVLFQLSFSSSTFIWLCPLLSFMVCLYRTFDATTLSRQINFKDKAFDLISQLVKCKGQDQKEFSENCSMWTFIESPLLDFWRQHPVSRQIYLKSQNDCCCILFDLSILYNCKGITSKGEMLTFIK